MGLTDMVLSSLCYEQLEWTELFVEPGKTVCSVDNTGICRDDCCSAWKLLILVAYENYANVDTGEGISIKHNEVVFGIG